jgi:lysophospholipase L1-like esterase
MESKSKNQLFVFEGWWGVIKIALIWVALLVGISAVGITVETAPYRYLNIHQMARLKDLGQLEQFRTANIALTPDSQRVVFIGDSITRMWDFNISFHNPHYVNRGIDAQTSADILIRFRQDVIGLQPRTVIILDGVNDFLEGYSNGRITGDQMLFNLEANDQTMAELAELHHTQPVFISMLPLHAYTPGAKKLYQRVPPDLILRMNQWLRTYCATHNYQYIDVFPAMVDSQGMLRNEYSDDGLHPNETGYQVMTLAFSNQFRAE